MHPADEATLALDTESYITQYLAHVETVKAHLRGQTGDQFLPSYIPLTGYWTPAEKDLFFHAVAVYSRFRPDLIAASIKSKTVADVCAYITLLDEASSKNPVNPNTFRWDLDIAMEVSAPWIQLEETNATAILSREPAWDDFALEQRRTLEIEEEEARLLAQFPSDDAEGLLQHRLAVWKDDKTVYWAKEDALKSLDLVALIKLDSLLRSPEGEPSHERSSSLPYLPESSQVSFVDEPPPTSEPSTPPPETVPSENPSPKSLRQLKKRLYMRKIRAAKNGTMMSNDTAKLQRGPKKKARKQRVRPKAYKMRTMPRSQNKQMVDSDDEEHDDPNDENYAHHNQPGKNRLERTKQLFDERGIDADFLSSTDLGLFNLAALGRLSKLFGTLDGDKQHPATLSADAIRLFTAIITDFLTQAIHHAIICREMERRLKEGLKVWKLADEGEILSSNVESALEIMGVRRSKKRFFQDLVGDADTDEEEGRRKEPQVETEIDGSDTESDGTESDDSDVHPHHFCVSQEMHVPLVNLPHLFRPSQSSIENDLMPMETDEEEFDIELNEEIEVNKADEIAQQKFQNQLWGQLS